MDELKMVPENDGKIKALLKKTQIGCTARLLTLNELKKSLEVAELILDKILKKQSRQNIKAWVRPKYGEFSATYWGSPEHTQCCIRRGRKYWFIQNIERAKAIRSGSSFVEIDNNSLEYKHGDIVSYVTKNLTGNQV